MTASKSVSPSLLLRLVILLAAMSPNLAAAPQGAFLDISVPDAFVRAETQGKIVCLYFHNPDEPESRRMLRTTFQDKAVIDWLKENTIAVRVDSTVDKATVSRFGIGRFPVTQLRAADKHLLEIMEFFHTPEALLAAAKATLAGRKITSLPLGKDAEDPYAWLAWGNYLFSNVGDPADMIHAYWWCLINAEQYSPGFRARYFEFIIKRLAYTKRLSQLGLTRLFSERNRLSGLLFGGAATDQAAYELVRLNFWLRKEDDTRRVFLDLAKSKTLDPSITRALMYHQLAGLVANKHYKELMGHLGDPLNIVERRHERMQQARERAKKAGVAVDLGYVVTGLKESRAQWVEDSANFYEILIHEGLGKDAKDVVDLVLKEVPTGRAYAIFMSKAIRLGLNDIAEDLADRGLKVVKGNGAKKIRTALMRMNKVEPPPEGGEDDK